MPAPARHGQGEDDIDIDSTEQRVYMRLKSTMSR